MDEAQLEHPDFLRSRQFFLTGKAEGLESQKNP
jgi:hypothetical protein